MNTLSIREIVLLLLLSGFVPGEFSFADDPESTFPEFNPLTRPVERAPPEDSFDRPPTRNSTKLSDDPAGEPTGTGFKWPTLPKPKMPTLPKPTLPKFALPSSWTSETSMPRERMHTVEEPSTWDKFSTGTKDLFTKTKQTLMPWSQEESVSSARKTPQPQRRTPPKTAARTKAKSASTEKKSLFPWFSKKEDKPMETVNDFLAQPRIR